MARLLYGFAALSCILLKELVLPLTIPRRGKLQTNSELIVFRKFESWYLRNYAVFFCFCFCCMLVIVRDLDNNMQI